MVLYRQQLIGEGRSSLLPWISWDQTPASFILVKGKIQDRIVKLSLKGGRTGSLRFGSNNTMVIAVQDANGRATSTTLFPVWSLVDRERGDDRVVNPVSLLGPDNATNRITASSPLAPDMNRHRKKSDLVRPDNSTSGSNLDLLSREPRADAMRRGQVVFVNNRSCPPGQIKRVTAGNKGVAGSRQRECVAR